MLFLIFAEKSDMDHKNKLLKAHTNDAYSRIGESILVANAQLVHTNHNNNVVHTYPAFLGYIKAKETLPKDILADYEEYSIPDSSAFSDEEHSYERASNIPTKSELSHHGTPTEVTEEVTLAEIAEKVTQDIDTFLKSHSRSNSDVSSTLSSINSTTRGRPKHKVQSYDSASQSSTTSNVTFSSTADQSLSLRMNRELYIDKIISEKHRVNLKSANTGRFIYRPGITNTQLYYSKELASMYDIVTPHLLYVSETSTKDSMRNYRNQVQVPAISQVVMHSCY